MISIKIRKSKTAKTLTVHNILYNQPYYFILFYSDNFFTWNHHIVLHVKDNFCYS